MTIYLRHPVHGTKVATMSLEVEFDEQNGWERYNPDTLSAPEEAVPEVAAPVNELEPKRRRSRPPAEVAAPE